MAWIESHQELARHPKTRRLARALGISVPAAIGHLHLLWYWAMDFAQDGWLGEYRAQDLADAALWDGDAQALWDALLDARFMDAGAEGAELHDWQEYAGRLLEKRRQDAERKRKGRGPRPVSNGRPGEVHRTAHVTVPLPDPDRTGPDPQEIKPPVSGPGVVVVGAGGRRAARSTAAEGVESLVPAYSEGAQTVLQKWREYHGKRAPPRLNPTQALKLEAAVAELGVARLCESAEWTATRGLAEFHKTLTAAYTKRQRDEAQQEGTRHGVARESATAPDRFAAFRKFGGARAGGASTAAPDERG